MKELTDGILQRRYAYSLIAQTGHARSPHDAPELEKFVVRISRPRISRRAGGLKKLAAVLSSAGARAGCGPRKYHPVFSG
jgi:hypothetical protein